MRITYQCGTPSGELNDALLSGRLTWMIKDVRKLVGYYDVHSSVR